MIRKAVGLAPGGIEWTFAPIWILMPVIVAAHIVGLRQARGDSAQPERAPRPGIPLSNVAFVRGFVLAAWLVVLFLFTPLHRSPFIYFQF